MIISLYLNDESYNTLLNNSTDAIRDIIENIDAITKRASKSGDRLFKSYNFYYSSFNDNEDFCDWLFNNDKEDTALHDYKKLLSKSIEQYNNINDSDYESNKTQIINGDHQNYNALINISKISDSIWYINNITKWSKVHRYYLKYSSTIDQFIDGIEDCFLNLYFHHDIKSSLHTLNYPFKDYIEEIIEHLTALNDEFLQIYMEYKNNGYQVIAQHFKSTTQIDCSPEASRQGISNREFSFINQTKQEIAVTCELHTKFSKFRKDKDRLYFNPGNSRLAEDKILIAHIGKHL